MQHNGAVIEVHNVSKHIKGRQILDAVSFVIQHGSISGIKGHNGAGKSMLLRTIAGLVLPSHGHVRVFGERIGADAEFPRDTGAMIDGPGLLPHYSGFQNLHFLAMIRNRISKAEIADAMRLVGLNPDDKRPVRTYSTGMRQRLGIAQAIMEHPALLLLDEPTSAIDAEGRQVIYRILQQQREQGATILLTSHSEEELAALCDQIFFMDGGKLVGSRAM